MKSPDEIKKGLECSVTGGCKGTNVCPYFDINNKSGWCINDSRKDALAYILRLEADNAQLNRCIENMTDMLNAAHDETACMKAEVNKFEEGYDALVKIVKRLEAEKEAMQNDMRECSHCTHHDVDDIYIDCCYDCNACDHDSCPCKECSGYNKWEWRGVQKEE